MCVIDCIKDGRNDSSPKVKPKCVDRQLVAGYEFNLSMLVDGTGTKLKSPLQIQIQIQTLVQNGSVRTHDILASFMESVCVRVSCMQSPVFMLVVFFVQYIQYNYKAFKCK